MKHFSYLRAIAASFYSTDLYEDVGRNWRGMGFQYLAIVFATMGLLFILMWVAVVSTMNPRGFAEKVTDNLFERGELTFDEGINRLLQTLAQIPPMRLENGRLHVDAEQPHIIYDPLTKRKLAIIDTTDTFTELEHSDTLALFGSTKIITSNTDHSGEDVFYFSSLRQTKNYDEQDINLLFGILSQIPHIELHNGKVSLDKVQPYFINHPVTDDELVIIDTTGRYRFPEEVTAPVLITKNTIFIKRVTNEGYTEIYLPDTDISMVSDYLENTARLVKKFLLWFIPLVILPLFMTLFFSIVVILLLIYGGLGLGIATYLKIHTLEYSDLVRLSTVSFTPVLLLNLLLPQFIPNQGLVYFLISVGYLFFAINANTQSGELKN